MGVRTASTITASRLDMILLFSAARLTADHGRRSVGTGMRLNDSQ
jgi:hypothetical protein